MSKSKVVTKKYYINLLKLNNENKVESCPVLKIHTDIEEGHKAFVDSVLAVNSDSKSDTHVAGLRSEYVCEVDCERLFSEGSVCLYQMTPKELEDMRKVFAENGIDFVNPETQSLFSNDNADVAVINDRGTLDA